MSLPKKSDFNPTNLVVCHFFRAATAIMGLGIIVLLATAHSSEARMLQWAKRAGATDSEAGAAIAVDSSGNSYVTGYFEGTTTLGLNEISQTTLTAAGATDLFLTKYSPTGALIWAKRAGGAGYDEAFAIEVDGSGNSYVTGYFEGAATFGFGEGNQTVLTSTSNGSNLFVAKYDGTGTLVWAKRASGSGSGQGFGVRVSGSGAVYVTGSFGGSITFGSGEANTRL
jgi:hypothetical protein